MSNKKRNKGTKEDQTSKQIALKRNGDHLFPYLCIAIIIIATYFVFSPSLQNGFTNWDDDFYVVHNPLVINNSVPIVKILQEPVASNYHPLTILSLALNYQSSKLDPTEYHLENVIFHLLNTILVFFFIYFLTRRNLVMALIVALFFGIHPMHVESVSWISERKDVLYVFFFLAGLISYLQYNRSKHIGWYVFTLLLFILSCLSKAMAVVFPAILLLIDYLNNEKWERRLFLDKIPFFVLSLIVGVVAIKAQTVMGIDTKQTFTLFQRLVFVSHNAVMYIIKFFLPIKLSAFYPYPIDNGGQTLPLIFYFYPFLVLVIIGLVIYSFRKKQKEIVFGLLFYFVSIALVLQSVKVGMAIMADRYSYLSYIGLLFVVAYLINNALQNKGGSRFLLRYPVIIIVTVGLVIFSYQTYSRTQIWKNSETLWTDVVNNYPTAYPAYRARGDYYYDNHEWTKALSDYNKAIECDSNYLAAYTNRAHLYFSIGKIDLALNDCNKAIALNPTSADCYYNRGFLYSNLENKKDLAIEDYTQALKLDPNYKSAWLNRGLLYSAKGKLDSAIVDFTKAIELDPSYFGVYINRAIAHYKHGENELALQDFTMAISVDPSDPNTYSNRASYYMQIGKNDLAIDDWDKAIGFDPSSALYYYNRGQCFMALSQYKQAMDNFNYGSQLNTPHPELFFNMKGICNINLQNFTEAIANFSKAIQISSSNPQFWLNRSFAENKMGQNENSKADALKASQLQGSGH